MAIQVQGNGGNVAEVDGTIWRALRTTDRPVEYGAGGYFRTVVAGTTAAAPAAGANLVSFRWTSASLLAIIREITLKVQVTTASTAGLPEMAAFLARTFTASDTGGTAVTLTGNSMKERTSFATTALGDLRFATGGVLTAGTRTLDSQQILDVSLPLALGGQDTQSWKVNGPGEHPIVLAQNEGLVFQNVNALTAGAYRYVLAITWGEVPAY